MRSTACAGRWRNNVIHGPKTTIPLHQALIEDPEFQAGDYSIKWLERWLAARAAHPSA